MLNLFLAIKIYILKELCKNTYYYMKWKIIGSVKYQLSKHIYNEFLIKY